MVQNYTTVTDGFHRTCEGDHRQRDAEFKNQDSFRDSLHTSGLLPGCCGTVERPLLLRVVQFSRFSCCYEPSGICEDQNTFINKCMELLGTIILLFVRLQSNHETALLLAVRPPTKRCAIYTLMHFFLNHAFNS